MSSISYKSDLVTCPLFTAISQTCNALHCPDFIKCYASYNYGRLSSVALPLVGGGISSHVGKTCFLISFLFSVVLSFICSRFGLGFTSKWSLTFSKKCYILNMVSNEYNHFLIVSLKSLVVGSYQAFLYIRIELPATSRACFRFCIAFNFGFLFACCLAWLNYIIGLSILQ